MKVTERQQRESAKIVVIVHKAHGPKSLSLEIPDCDSAILKHFKENCPKHSSI